MLLLAITFDLSAQDREKYTVSVSLGYQQEDFSWSIAGDMYGQNPNIYSELKWDHLIEIASSAAIKWRLAGAFYATASYSRNFIQTGKVSDTDYGSDNRQTPIYHGDFKDDRGYTNGIMLGLGWNALHRNKFTLAVESGYCSSHQSLYLLGLNGQHDDLRTTYFTAWDGIFIAGSVSYELGRKFSLGEKISYKQINYSARADWNLIQQFAHPVSFRDQAQGYQLQVTPSFTYSVSRHLTWNLSLDISHSKTGSGKDRLFLSNGGQEQTQFNLAEDHSYQLTTGLIFQW